jgi:hypothetical protein
MDTPNSEANGKWNTKMQKMQCAYFQQPRGPAESVIAVNCSLAGDGVAKPNIGAAWTERDDHFDFSSSSIRAGTISKRSPTTP